jgi:flagellar hook-basal body complex protein FliE
MMSDLETFGIEKPRPIKPGAKRSALRASKEMDLNVHVPTIHDSKAAESGSFKGILVGALDGVNAQLHHADDQIERLAAGEIEDLHEVTIAMEEANQSFEMMLQIRNQLLSAYDELKQM